MLLYIYSTLFWRSQVVMMNDLLTDGNILDT